MFVVVTVICCWLGWQASIVRQRHAALKEIEESPVFEAIETARWQHFPPPGQAAPPRASVPMLRRWIGDVAIQEIWCYPWMQTYSEADRERFARIFPEATFHESHPEPCHPGCFPSGTLVETPQGLRNIESIVVGDLITIILSTGESGSVPVQSIFVTDNQLWEVETESETLLTTETQPLCLSVNTFVSAGDMKLPTTILRYQDGEIQPSKVLKVTRTDHIEKVFNLVLGNSEVFIAGGYLARSKPPANLVAQ
jgi:hypothetical protein